MNYTMETGQILTRGRRSGAWAGELPIIKDTFPRILQSNIIFTLR